jgi:hypothetical protein
MSIAGKPFPFVLAAMMIALWSGAPTASAQLEVTEEDLGAHCPAVLSPGSGGCEIHLQGEKELSGHLFGIEISESDCVVELEGRIGEGGDGWVESSEFADHPGVDDCIRIPCGLPWSFRIEEDDPAGSGEVIHFEWCDIETPGTGVQERCDLEASLGDVGDHDYEIAMNDLAGIRHSGSACEFDGQLAIESEQHEAIEIVH